MWRIPGLMALAWLAGCGQSTDGDSPLSVPVRTSAQSIPVPKFQFPTANHALLHAGGETNFFTPTGPGRPWTSGAFGCVRNSGTRIHEGIDISALHRDVNGEATDPVHASFAGKVVYINSTAATSNYGIYIVLEHESAGLPIYTLYAHLKSVTENLSVGQALVAGELLGILGRTSNTREGISKNRAHLHFEIGLQIHTQFESWFRHWYRDGKNHHGAWNGMNLLGLDAAEILTAQASQSFDLVAYLARQPMLCRVRIHQPELEWAKRFPQLVEPSTHAESLPVQAWDVDLNFNAIPFRLKPVYAKGLKQKAGGVSHELLEVNDMIRRKHPCRSLVFKKGARWVLTSKGMRALDLLAWSAQE